LITTNSLQMQSWKDLAEMAKNKGLSGWHSMRKDELVKAILRAVKKSSRARAAAAGSKPRKSSTVKARNITSRARPHGAHAKPNSKHAPAAKINGSSKSHPGNKLHSGSKPVAAKASVAKVNGKSAHHESGNGKSATHDAPNGHDRPRTAKQVRISDRIHRVQAERERLKDLSGSFSVAKTAGKRKAPEKDRLVLMVRDPYWLQAIWTITRQSVKRAEAALAEHWHTSLPVLRLLEVDGGHTTSTAERLTREIDVHGGVTNWYIEVANPPHSFRVELGYKSAGGRFFALCRSNIVHTPAPDSGDVIDENWTDVAENYERVYALSGGYAEDNQSGELQELFEERLHRPMSNTASGQFGSGAERVLNRHRDLDFHVDAEMILYGRTKPDAKVTLAGEPIKLRSDGSFTIRQPMPDRRQVLPVVASTPDGVEQRTIVIAVERNTKVLEPMHREANE
jgi:uncharacterized protein